MAITQHKLVPDVTIRHLLTTMTMDWRCPLKRPEELQRIQRLKLRNGIEWSEAIKIADPRGFQQIKTRCGEGVLFRMLEFCSQPKMTVRFEILQELQEKLIGRDRVGFRESNAFTSVRNERYAWFEPLENMFRIKIRRDDAEEIHPLFIAIRLYLDIQFVHPFVDGNARSGMLWFAFHCWRAGFRLPDFRKIHGYGFVPGNRLCYHDFCDFVISDLLLNES